MRDFCELYWRLDSTTKTTEKVVALEAYFRQAAPKDAIWAVYFLTGSRIKRLVKTGLLRQWATEEAGLSQWLFEECYDRVGDLAETISLVLPPKQPAPGEAAPSLQSLIENQLMPLREMEEEGLRQSVVKLWQQFDQRERFVL
ncbi:MAG: ATP-dependent DNA ligase, partial [Planctomycetaceae bacterium]|nr:ATP-dependent DNA ligase [Planctomycetaceae bacterium]